MKSSSRENGLQSATAEFQPDRRHSKTIPAVTCRRPDQVSCEPGCVDQFTRLPSSVA